MVVAVGLAVGRHVGQPRAIARISRSRDQPMSQRLSVIEQPVEGDLP